MTNRINALAPRACRRPRNYRVPPGAPVIVLLMFFLSTRGWAAAYGSVSGIVRDGSDRPVAGAKVVLESATHAIVERQTDPTGRFAFSNVAIGRASCRERVCSTV